MAAFIHPSRLAAADAERRAAPTRSSHYGRESPPPRTSYGNSDQRRPSDPTSSGNRNDLYDNRDDSFRDGGRSNDRRGRARSGSRSRSRSRRRGDDAPAFRDSWSHHDRGREGDWADRRPPRSPPGAGGRRGPGEGDRNTDAANGETYFDQRRRRREESTLNIWPPSPVRRDDTVDDVVSRKRKPEESADSEDDSDDDSDVSAESERRKDRKKSKSKSKKDRHRSSKSKKEKKKHKKSSSSKKSKKSKKKNHDSSDESDDSDASAVEPRASSASAAGESAIARGGSLPAPRGVGSGKLPERDAEVDDYWQERPVAVADDAPIGPVPYVEPEKKLDERAYGGALLAGEGSAMAAFIQSGKRIPRRGEIGLTSEEIETFENVGYVMSGSRHRRMNAVRIRKENQVISAEEKNALLLFNQQEKVRKENETIALLKEMVAEKMKEKQVQ
ncbi:ras-induced vulval development antagonist-domain-containing protein [Zopfochytrium polystomum]|nr:ras-induced vulval development antagonist-domain-containing protein [Zopfochytrium polystomum]